MSNFINKLNYKEDGHLVSDEIFELTSEKMSHDLNHHNLIESFGISVWSGLGASGNNITDFSISYDTEKPYQCTLIFGSNVPLGTYYVTYYSQGDENDADDINKLQDEVSQLSFLKRLGITQDGHLTIDGKQVTGGVISQPDPEEPITPPNPITNLQASNITSNSLRLSWSTSSSGGALMYEVHKDGILVTTVSNNSYTVTGLSDETEYEFTVYAKYNNSDNSAGVNVIVKTLDVTPPNNVTNLQANIGTNELTLSWTASNSNDVVGYDIYKDGTFLTHVTTTNIMVSELLSDTEYTFSVRAKDSSGNVANGTTITVTTSKEQEESEDYKYLIMNGTNSDYLMLPRVNWNRIVIDGMYPNPRVNDDFFIAEGNTYGDLLHINSNLQLVSVGGAFSTGVIEGFKINERTILNLVADGNSPATDNNGSIPNSVSCSLFGSFDNSDPNIQSHVYDVKIYNHNTLVAHFDMTTGTVQDQSGNNNHATLYGGTWVSNTSKTTIDDTNFTWHLKAMRAKDYWERGLTGKGVKVAIIDTGVGYHTGLNVKDGVDFLNPTNPNYRLDSLSDGHGTAVAGVLAGKLTPSTMQAGRLTGGIAPDVELYHINAWDGGVLTLSRNRVHQAYQWCIDNDIDIINLSHSYDSDDSTENAWYQTLKDNGILLVTASGNENAHYMSDGYPIHYPRKSEIPVVVTGLDQNMRRDTYSCYGESIDFTAPSNGIEEFVYSYPSVGSATNYPTGGTSFSSPLVAGVFAIYKQAFPNSSWDEIYDMVRDSTRKIDGQTGWDMYRGWGLPQPSAEILAMPKKQPEQELNGNSLIVVSHYDDDTAFEPDIQRDMIEKESVTTLYLTASDAGKIPSYYESREAGMRHVYSYMAGVSNNWTADPITINGKIIHSMVLNDTNIRHIYLRLPDGNYNGTGFVRNNHESLQKLWDGQIQSITTKDNVLYNKNDILSLVSEIIDTYEIDSLKHMYHLLVSPSVGQHNSNHEHSDHIIGGYVAYEGAMLSQSKPEKAIAYGIDFPHDEQHTINLTQEERNLRFEAISIYEPYDENFLVEWLTEQEFLDSLWYIWRYPYKDENTANSTMTIVSHYDDEYSINPDFYYDIKNAREEDTVVLTYVTAWEDASQVALLRTEPTETIISHIADKPNSWSKYNLVINGEDINIYKLDDTNIYYLNLMIPHGNVNGGGVPQYGNESLEKLWKGDISSIRSAINSSKRYSLDDIINLISGIIDHFEVDTLRHIIHTEDFSVDLEHSDHYTVGKISHEGVKRASHTPNEIIAYRIDSNYVEGATELNEGEWDIAVEIADLFAPLVKDKFPYFMNWRNDPELIEIMSHVWRYPYTIGKGDNDEDTIVVDGLVSYYNSKQGVTGNVWNNISPNANGSYNGVINGATVNQDGMYFDGTGDYVEFPMPSELLVDTSFTIEFMLDGLTSRGQYADIFSPSSIEYMIYFGKNSNDLWVDFNRNEDSNQEISSNNTKYYSGEKAFFTCVFDTSSSTSKLFKNGILIETTGFSFGDTRVFINNQQFRLGTYGVDHPQGVIDCLRIYNRALTQEEVQQNYEVGREIGLDS